MRIDGIRTLSGPNVYSHRLVLLMRLDLEKLYEKEGYEVPGFVERLLALLPGLREHHCSKGYEGGFVERLDEGTYFGHTVECSTRSRPCAKSFGGWRRGRSSSSSTTGSNPCSACCASTGASPSARLKT
jgi:hypothetical protein